MKAKASLKYAISPVHVPGHNVPVPELPRCDFCGEVAEWDFQTKYRCWAHACDAHYFEHRAHNDTGVGQGQHLFVG